MLFRACTMASALSLPFALHAPVLALGSEMKNTVCIAAGTQAWVSAPLDDLKDAASFDEWRCRVETWPCELGIEPAIIAHDLHPEYVTTKAAPALHPRARHLAVQHHEAHVASCCASEGCAGRVIGLAFDGTGYGADGTLWGGEFFTGSLNDEFVRRARLRPMTLAGGEAAIREPWRIALALLHDAGVDESRWRALPRGVPAERLAVVQHLLSAGADAPVRSSSVGRLFDGVAALLGICPCAEREAQAAVALEHAAGATDAGGLYPLPFAREDALEELDWRPMVQRMSDEMGKGASPATLAARFHDSLAEAVAAWCARIDGGAVKTVAAAGGVFWNRRFTHSLRAMLEERGCTLVTPSRVPPSDAGLSLGQAVLAGVRAASVMASSIRNLKPEI